MAYSGTTAASSLRNPPIKIAGGIAPTLNTRGLVVGTTSLVSGGGNSLWIYSSTDTQANILADTAYFTDGHELGMRNGDWLLNSYASTVASTTVSGGLALLGSTNSTAGYTIMTAALITST